MKRLIIFLPYCIIALISAGLVFVTADKEQMVTTAVAAPLIIVDAGHGGYVLTVVA